MVSRKVSPDFGDQCQTQSVHVVEMPVETGRHDAGAACDFTQAQAAKAATTVHQTARRVHQGVAGLQFLFGARL